jgi:hypothetical protein
MEPEMNFIDTVIDRNKRNEGEEPARSRSERHRLALRRLEAKQQAIQELIAGRLHLVDAAARFHAASRLPLDSVAQASAEALDPLILEDLCRTVIGWAYLALSDRPEAADRLSDRLETQLNDYLAHQAAAN